MAISTKIAKYEIQRRIRQGGMGAVYLGFDPELERPVAVKVLRDDVDGDDSRARFAHEARAAAGLRHPHIVTIHDFGVHDGHPYLVMEFIPGETLAEIIARRAAIPLARRLQLIEELCDALAYAHKLNLVHRDIKPGNVMLDSEGAIKVLDFGIASTPESPLTAEGVVMGTPNYMSPEHLTGGPVDHRSDIFAVGAVLYELMTFTPAFGAGFSAGVIRRIFQENPPPLRLFHSDLDSALSGIVQRALEKDPAKRYQDLSAMRGDLARIRMRIEREGVHRSRQLRPAATIRRTIGTKQTGSSKSAALLEQAPDTLNTGEFERAIATGEEAWRRDPSRLDPSKIETQRIREHARQGSGAPNEAPTALNGDWKLRLLGHAVLAVLVGSVSAWSLVRPWGTPSSAVTELPSRGAVTIAPAVPHVSPSAPAVPARRRSETGDPVVHENEPHRGAEPLPPAPPLFEAVENPRESTGLQNWTAGMLPVSLPPPPPAEPRKSDSFRGNEPEPTPVADRRELASNGLPRLGASPGITYTMNRRDESPSRQTDAQLIEQTLQEFAAAVSARDGQALSQVVLMDAAARVDQQPKLDKYDSLSMKLRVLQEPEIAGSHATVRCSTEEKVGLPGRPRRERASKVEITLQKNNGRWMVRGVRELR